jgi:Arc/MetJ-type ribon-helix-helix transcriptional regulator
MAGKKVKQPTERITVRLPIAQIDQMNALVQAGRFRTTTDIVFQAVRDFLTAQGAGAKQVIESEKGLAEFNQVAALMDQLRRAGLK